MTLVKTLLEIPELRMRVRTGSGLPGRERRVRDGYRLMPVDGRFAVPWSSP